MANRREWHRPVLLGTLVLAAALAALPAVRRGAAATDLGTRAARHGRFFVEQPALASVPFDFQREDLRVDASRVPAALAEWEVVRVDRGRRRVVALSLGPTAMYRMQGQCASYELHVSRDGGATFEAPLSLALGELSPYTARTASMSPLLRGGRVAVEAVRCREEGPDTQADDAAFPCYDDPPMAVLLAFDLAELRRDADGDGLTDAREAWWGLDPAAPDTDGDTVTDAKDAIPRVPAGLRAGTGELLEWLVSDAAHASLAASNAADEERRKAGSPGPHERPSPAAGSVAEPPLYLALAQPVELFREHWMRHRGPAVSPPSQPGPRIIAFSEAEARERTFTSQFIRVGLTIEPDGSRAWIELNLGEEGGTYLAERTPTGWTLQRLGGWVS